MAEPLVQAAERAGLSILESSVLGALLLLALIACVVLYRKCQQVQDQRVADTKAMSRRVIDMAHELSEVALRLRVSLERHTDVELETQRTVGGLKGAMETVVLTAVRERRTGRKL